MSNSTHSDLAWPAARTIEPVQLAKLCATVSTASPSSKVDFAPQTRPDPSVGRYSAAALADPASGAATEVIAAHCRQRGLQFGRHGASLVFQRYAHRVLGVATAAALLHRTALDLRAASVLTQFEAASPTRLLLRSAQTLPDPSPAQVAAVTIDGHLRPMAATWLHAGGISMRNLWGNMAASLALGVRRAADTVGIGPALEFAEAVFEAVPELAGLGEFVVVSDDRGSALFFERASCCHWYAAHDGKLCSWCSRHTHAQRLKIFRQALAASRQ